MLTIWWIGLHRGIDDICALEKNDENEQQWIRTNSIYISKWHAFRELCNFNCESRITLKNNDKNKNISNDRTYFSIHVLPLSSLSLLSFVAPFSSSITSKLIVAANVQFHSYKNLSSAMSPPPSSGVMRAVVQLVQMLSLLYLFHSTRSDYYPDREMMAGKQNGKCVKTKLLHAPSE